MLLIVRTWRHSTGDNEDAVFSLVGLSSYTILKQSLFTSLLVWSAKIAQIVAAWQPGCEKMEREWGNGERMRKWREIHSLHFLILSLFVPCLSISYIKICHILSQNVKYGFFVANVTKKLTYALWGNNSGPNSLWGSSASCAGLDIYAYIYWYMDGGL